MRHDDPGSPQAWLIHAKSDLLLAKLGDHKEILLNQLCFHAQQTAEKSLKAILIHENIEFPFTHNIKSLVLSLPDRIEKPEFLGDLAILSKIAPEKSRLEITLKSHQSTERSPTPPINPQR